MENFHHTLAQRSTDADAWHSREKSTVFLVQEENLSEKIWSRLSISLMFFLRTRYPGITNLSL